ncbi:MAG: preprotein translocase subunit SecE [Ignavibacteriae bacterium]|nr:preprotein translocase subunit SecE [Ignavibacteria bacterium]MBI3365570.1 preprotein translocase subunit SecE [Ignavibacteriota bacterium]
MKEKIIGFFTDVVKEMKKVTWPRPDELRESTIIVLAVCGVIAAFIFGVDWIVSNVLKAIL